MEGDSESGEPLSFVGRVRGPGGKYGLSGQTSIAKLVEAAVESMLIDVIYHVDASGITPKLQPLGQLVVQFRPFSEEFISEHTVQGASHGEVKTDPGDNEVQDSGAKRQWPDAPRYPDKRSDIEREIEERDQELARVAKRKVARKPKRGRKKTKKRKVRAVEQPTIPGTEL